MTNETPDRHAFLQTAASGFTAAALVQGSMALRLMRPDKPRGCR